MQHLRQVSSADRRQSDDYGIRDGSSHVRRNSWVGYDRRQCDWEEEAYQ